MGMNSYEPIDFGDNYIKRNMSGWIVQFDLVLQKYLVNFA